MASKKAPRSRDLEEDDDSSSSSSSSSSSGNNNPKTDPKADELVKNADKRLKEWVIFNPNQKYEDACEMLTKAAAMYKINKNWKQAGDCYVRIADIQLTNLKDSTDACNKYVDAAKAFKNYNPKDAQKYFQKAVEMHMENNRTSTAAKLWKELAELNEKDMNYKAAMEAYQKAADCYQAEDSNVNANAMRIKIATLAAEDKDYARAIEIYESVSKASLDSNSGRWSVKDYLFKSLLCHMALAAKSHDMNAVEDAASRYRDMLPQLDGTREIKLIDDAIESFKDEDLDRFRSAVRKFDEIVRLDNFTASILIEVQSALENGPSEAAHGGDDADDLT